MEGGKGGIKVGWLGTSIEVCNTVVQGEPTKVYKIAKNRKEWSLTVLHLLIMQTFIMQMFLSKATYEAIMENNIKCK